MMTEDLEILDGRVSKIDLSRREIPQILSSKNADVDRYNTEIYQRSPNRKCMSVSKDRMISNMSEKKAIQFLQKLTTDATKTGCLELALCENLTYDIIINLDVSDGLVNGTSGRLKYIQFVPGYNNPTILWFDFPEEHVGQKQRRIYRHCYTDDISRGWTPIILICRKFNIGKQYVEISRTQFPVKQSSAKTIHKSQGSTYDEIIVNVPGPYYSFVRHMYVALSRVRSLDGLHLVRFNAKSIKTDSRVTEENQDGLATRYVNIGEDIVSKHVGSLLMHFQNCQSLVPHFDNIKKLILNHKYNIVAICETRLTSEEDDTTFGIDGYTLVRQDAPSFLNYRSSHGLLMYISDVIVIIDIQNYSTDTIEAMSIKIEADNMPYTIIVGYKAPKCKNEDLFLCLKWCKDLYRSDDNVIIVGDFNTDTTDPTKYLTLNQMLGILTLDMIRTDATTKKGTILDLYFTNCPIITYLKYLTWSLHFGITALIYPKRLHD